MAVAYEPIKPVKHLRPGTSTPSVIRQKEAATQTFKEGVPVALASGYVQECAFGGSEKVYGISAEAGHNLTAAGTAQETSEATPPNQPSAKTIPHGSWVKDGKIMVFRPSDEQLFSAMLKDGQVFTVALVSETRYALIKDGTSGYWYIDNTDSGTNDEHAAQILGVDDQSPNTVAGGARVIFKIASAARFAA